MKNLYLAKSKPTQTIKEHTAELIKQYTVLKQIYPDILTDREWELLNYAIKYHDIGKINTKFQNKLYKKLKYSKKKLLPDNQDEEIPHNFLSPCFIPIEELKKTWSEEEIKFLVSAVYYHHNRKEKEITQQAIEDLKKQAEEFGDFFELPIQEVKKCSKRYILHPIDETSIELLESKAYILLKGLLNKLDYVASINKENVKVEESCWQNKKCVSDIIKEITKENYDNKFRPVQQYMMDRTDKNLVVISYTGSGKTEAALLWIESSKAFYTLPLKVSINAMAKRIRQEIGYQKALLLHSDAYTYYQENDTEQLNLYDRAKRLASPLTITTVDQLFKIAFRYQGYEEILATLSYSKIVIDEIQMYSPEMIAYILIGLSMVTKLGGKFAIITATFPPILYEFMDQLKIPYEKQSEQFIPHIKNRHKIEIEKNTDFNLEEIKEAGKKQRVLIIVNTVKKAQNLYEKLKDENTHLLHAHYLKTDRNKLEETILEFGQTKHYGKAGIWISTQIVEASLDIDFDVLHTEMCSIDSLFQRMGRVYRKRLYQEEKPNVYIYDNQNGVPYIIDKDIYQFSLLEIEKYNHQNLSEQDKQQIIENIFSKEKNKKLKDSEYVKKIKKEINLLTEIAPNEIEKSIINKKFRNIQNVELIPDNIYNELENKGKIEEWETIFSEQSTIEEKLKAKEEIKNYTISIRYNPKLDKGQEELFYKGSNIFRTRYNYEFDKKTLTGRGLLIEKIQEKGYFDE